MPLATLVACLLSQRCSSQQTSLDTFFTCLGGSGDLVRGASDRALARARGRLHLPALQGLNDQLLVDAERLGLIPRWRGRRLVAADASVLMPATRRCLRTVGLATRDQRLFALYLPGADLTLHAAVHSAAESERAMLMEALHRLNQDDVLLLDRGYPAAWLVQSLIERGIGFVLRCDMASGWPAVRTFIRSGQAEATVSLNRPSAQDAADWGCQRSAPRVRLVRQVAPNGAVRVLATNLDAQQAPADDFGALYHQRWRIEEAFKRLKHNLHLESVSGLSQHALLIDVASKVLADNIAALLTKASESALPHDRVCAPHANARYAAQLLQRALPRILLAVGDVLGAIGNVFNMLVQHAQRYRPGRSCPRPAHHRKTHPRFAFKG